MMKMTNYFQQLIESHALMERVTQNLIRDLEANGIEYIEVQDSILIQTYTQADADLTVALYKQHLTD